MAADAFDVVVRFAQAAPDVRVDDVTAQTTVAELRQMVVRRAGDSSLATKRLRFILRGRLLADAATLGSCGVHPGDTVHCAVSEQPLEDRAGQVDSHTARMVPNVGLDRLREAGFSEDDIHNYRQVFHGLAADTMDDDTLRQREEEWMASSSQPPTSEGTQLDIVWGLLLGFFVGFLVIFFVKQHQFNDRHLVGIVGGLFINVALAFLRSAD